MHAGSEAGQGWYPGELVVSWRGYFSLSKASMMLPLDSEIDGSVSVPSRRLHPLQEGGGS